MDCVQRTPAELALQNPRCPDCRTEFEVAQAVQNPQYVPLRIPFDPLADRYCRPHLQQRLTHPVDSGETLSIAAVPLAQPACPDPELLPGSGPMEALAETHTQDGAAPPVARSIATIAAEKVSARDPHAAIVAAASLFPVTDMLNPAAAAPAAREVTPAWILDQPPKVARPTKPMPALSSDGESAPKLEANEISRERLELLCHFIEQCVKDALVMDQQVVEKIRRLQEYLPRVSAEAKPFFEIFLLRYQALEHALDELSRVPIPEVLPSDSAQEPPHA